MRSYSARISFQGFPGSTFIQGHSYELQDVSYNESSGVDMRLAFYSIVVATLLVASTTSAFGTEAVPVSVCEINADPWKFEGIEVSVHGAIYVGVDVTNISDPACPGVAIQLSVSDEAYRNKDIRTFEREVRKYDMRAMATVYGQFHAKASVLPYPMPVIDLHAIKEVIFEAK